MSYNEEKKLYSEQEFRDRLDALQPKVQAYGKIGNLQQFESEKLFKQYGVMIEKSIKNGYCPYLPNEEGMIDTQPAGCLSLNEDKFKFFNGWMQIVFKTRQIELGAETPEFVKESTINFAEKNGYDVHIKRNETNPKATVTPLFVQSHTQDKDGNWNCNLDKYYNLNQLENPEEMRRCIREQCYIAKSERQEELKATYGEKAFKVRTDFIDLKPIDYTNQFKELKLSAGDGSPECLISQIITAGINSQPILVSDSEAVNVIRDGLTKLAKNDFSRPSKFKFKEFGKNVGQWTQIFKADSNKQIALQKKEKEIKKEKKEQNFFER